VWCRSDICSVFCRYVSNFSLRVGEFRWVVVQPLRLCVVRRTREQIEVMFYLVCRCLSVVLAYVLTGQTGWSLIQCFCAGDGKLCVPSGRKAFLFRLERVFYRGLFDTQGVSLGSSSSRCCVCVMPC
jgi:hypothetical protein